MKIIEHSYGADLDWVEPLAKKLEGKIEGNFIIAPNKYSNATRYFLDCGDGIVAYYVDVINDREINLIQKNTKNDFIGIYYNLTEGEVKYSSNSFAKNVGRWQYNLLVIDSILDTNYHVQAGTRSHVVCIFIKKNKMASFAEKNDISIHTDIDKITNSSKNTIVRFDRMSDESYHIIEDLSKLKVGGPVFDLNLRATINLLLSNFLKKMSSSRIILQTLNEKDLAKIIAIQTYLIDNIDAHFPTIQFMSKKSNMSESKFKNLFKKITGKTPNTFFMENKLIRAKELLEENQLTISQISLQLNFTNNSYFASKFKDYFGISPKQYLKQL